MGKLLVATLLVGSTATALAKTPGDDTGDASGAPGMVAPQPIVIAAPPIRDVMADRWAVGLSLGGFSISPDSAPDQQTQFDVGELALRFRATPHLELELAVGGGAETLSDGSQGDTQVSMGVLALRYRFAIESDWNWWLMGGVGEGVIDSKNVTDGAQLDADTRPLGELGVGLEHRWDHFALQAELEAVGMGQRKGGYDQPVAVDGGAAPIGRTAPQDTLSGGALTIGATYYF
ncbi:MAG: hypothetical protein ABI467_01245 [Kofleriaceae bacterium]